jgi:hypothetical protein
LPEVSGGGQKKTKLSNIFGWFWVCSQRYRSMITVVYFISGFIASFGTIFLRKVATFFYGRSPLWLQTEILWKKKKNNTARDDLGSVTPATISLLWDKLPHDCLLRAMDGWRDGWMESFISSRRPLLFKMFMFVRSPPNMLPKFLKVLSVGND